jgi:ribonucleoside-diphosphate reductase beta chain
LTAAEVKLYIRYIANFRLQQLGIEEVLYKDIENPLADWLDPLIYGSKHNNFFEGRTTDYARGAIEFDDDEDMEY